MSQLSSYEVANIHAIIEVALPSSCDRQRITTLLQGFMEHWRFQQRFAFRAALNIFSLSPWAFQMTLWPRPISQLSLPQRRKLIARFENDRHHMVRGIWKLIRVLLDYIYFGQREIMKRYGFDPKERVAHAHRKASSDWADASLERVEEYL